MLYLVIPLTEKLKSLGSLVHKDSVQMAGLHRADLYCFLTPAHNLIRMDIGWEKHKSDINDNEKNVFDTLHSVHFPVWEQTESTAIW